MPAHGTAHRTAHRVAVLALPSVVPFDFAVPFQVFGYAALGLGDYRLFACGVRAGRVETARGFAVVAPHGLDALRRARTIVVPGIDDLDRPIPAAVTRALVRAHARGARIVSICTGAFVLAAAGLLRGRRATTHWADIPVFASRFPDTVVDPGVLYVEAGRVLTSAGIAAGIDLCLHLVSADHGAEVANAVARRLVVPPHRSGGQAQFIPDPVGPPSGPALAATREWALARLGARLTVADLAAHAKLPVRTFARRFVAETGASPLQWLLRHRLLAAQRALETTDTGIERIAERFGFGTAISLRAHFRRTLGTSPLAYRRSFRAGRMA